MFAVIMVVLNGMTGLSVLLGGLKHREPVLNLQGANAYLGIIVPLATLTLIMPRFTHGAPGGVPGPALGWFLLVACVVLYLAFLGIQMVLHKHYFIQPGEDGQPSELHGDHDLTPISVPYHATCLLVTMLPIVLLSKSMAKIIDHGVEGAGLPAALGGLLVAVLVLSPEGLASLKAARANQLQRSINISMGLCVGDDRADGSSRTRHQHDHGTRR